MPLLESLGDLEAGAKVWAPRAGWVAVRRYSNHLLSYAALCLCGVIFAAGGFGGSVTTAGAMDGPLVVAAVLGSAAALWAVVRGLRVGSDAAHRAAEEMERRALREAYAVKRQWLFLAVATTTRLGRGFSVGRLLAFDFHFSLLSYTHGTTGIAALANDALHTRDYITLTDGNHSTLLGVNAQGGHPWPYGGLADHIEAPVTSGWHREHWPGRIRNTHTFFMLVSEGQMLGPRPALLRFGDRISLMGPNRVPVGPQDGGLAAASERHRPLLVEGGKDGDPVPAGGCVRFAVGPGELALTVDDSGRVGFFAPQSHSCPLRVDNQRAAPPMLVDWEGKKAPLSTVLDRAAVDREFGEGQEVRVAMNFGLDTASHVQWPSNSEPPRLSDTGFAWVATYPQAREQYDRVTAFLSRRLPTLLCVLCILWPLGLGQTWLGWVPSAVNVWARLGRVLVMAHTLRTVTFLCTSLPVTGPECAPTSAGGAEDWNHPPSIAEGWNWWDDWDLNPVICGDGIPSAAVINSVASVLVAQAYALGLFCADGLDWASRAKLIPYTLVYLGLGFLALQQAYLSVASRQHYSAGVILALYTTVFVFVFDAHVLFPRDVEPPPEVTWQWMARDKYGYLPLPEWLVAVLRQVFERGPKSKRSAE